MMSQAGIAKLALPLFLERALTTGGFSQLADLEGVGTDELANDLSIGRDVAEDVLRQAQEYQAASSTARQRTRSTQVDSGPAPLSQNLAVLLQPRADAEEDMAWSTGSSALDAAVTAAATFSGPMRGTSAVNGNGHVLTASRAPGLRVVASQGVGLGTGHETRSTPSESGPSQAPSQQALPAKRKRRPGLIPGQVLESAGPPGGGKTALAVGVAVDGRLCSGRVSGAEVLLVDTEGGITPGRLRDRAELVGRASGASPDEILSGILCLRLVDQSEFVAFWHTIEEYLGAHPKIKLIIVDTLSYHLRQPSMPNSQRKHLFQLIKQKLTRMSAVHGCAAILCNQLATKLRDAENKPANFDTGDRAVLMPQLGDAWLPARAVRVLLFRDSRGRRYAHVSNVADLYGDAPWVPIDIDIAGGLGDVARDDEDEEN